MYGLVRGVAVWPVIGIARWKSIDVAEWLIVRTRSARVLAAGQLVIFGAAVVVGVGL